MNNKLKKKIIKRLKKKAKPRGFFTTLEKTSVFKRAAIQRKVGSVTKPSSAKTARPVRKEFSSKVKGRIFPPVVTDYKRSLELATVGMVEILDVQRLIRLIVYMIIKKVKVTHAGVLLHDEQKQSYVLTSSRGKKGCVIPKEYIRIENDDPIIQFFNQHKGYSINKSGAVRLTDLTRCLSGKLTYSLSNEKGIKSLIYELREEMLDYDVDVLVPGYFATDNLMGILFLGKKNNGQDFQQDELDFFMALARTAVMAIRAAQLHKDTQKMFYGIIKAMSLSIEKFDPDFTRPHMDRIFEMGARMIERIEKKGIRLPDMPKELFISAIFLHDIGKQYVPREILHKPGKLTDDEWREIKKHPVDGAEIFEQIEGMHEVAAIIRYHQEKYNGTGYPEGLKGENIPLGARIAAVLDSFDAMTNSRPYRSEAFSIKDAACELIKEKAKQFDPELVDIFVDTLLEDGALKYSDIKDIYSVSSVGHVFENLVYK